MLEGVFCKWVGRSEDRLLTIIRAEGNGHHEKITVSLKEAQEIRQALEDEELRLKGMRH